MYWKLLAYHSSVLFPVLEEKEVWERRMRVHWKKDKCKHIGEVECQRESSRSGGWSRILLRSLELSNVVSCAYRLRFRLAESLNFCSNVLILQCAILHVTPVGDSIFRKLLLFVTISLSYLNRRQVIGNGSIHVLFLVCCFDDALAVLDTPFRWKRTRRSAKTTTYPKSSDSGVKYNLTCIFVSSYLSAATMASKLVVEHNNETKLY